MGIGPGGFEADQSGPLQQKGAGQRSEQIFTDQFQGLWRAAFEQGVERVGQLRAQVHGLASGSNQSGRLARLHIFRVLGCEPVPMLEEQVEQQTGVGQIVLGTRGTEGPAAAGALVLRVDRIERDELGVHQRLNDRSMGCSQSDGQGPAAKAPRQLAPSTRTRLFDV